MATPGRTSAADIREAYMMKAARAYLREYALNRDKKGRFGSRTGLKVLEFLAEKFDELLGTGWRDYLIGEAVPKQNRIHRGEYD